MHTIWYELMDESKHRIDVDDLYTAQLMWNSLSNAGYKMLSTKP